MVCKITEDIRKIVGDDKLIEVTRYVTKRMNYSFQAGKKEARMEILETLDKLITDKFILSSKEAFKFAEDFTPLYVKYVLEEKVKTPEFQKKFKAMLH